MKKIITLCLLAIVFQSCLTPPEEAFNGSIEDLCGNMPVQSKMPLSSLSNIYSERTQKAAPTRAKIELTQKVYTTGDTIQGLISGYLTTTGDCRPAAVWGLDKKEGDSWKSILDVNMQAQMNCGMPSHPFKRQNHIFCMLNESRAFFPHHQLFIPGEYKLSCKKGKSTQLVYSPVFRIK